MLSEQCIRDTCLTVTREGDVLRVVWSKSLRIKGFEPVEESFTSPDSSLSSAFDDRFYSSISRTRSLVRQYAACNDWDYFCTFTINPALFDSFDLSGFYKSFGQYIQNVNKRRKDSGRLLYMLIPEHHKSGAWHFHGLMVGIPEHFLSINSNGFLDWPVLRDKFGFCSFSPVRDHKAIALYMTKYITKDIFDLDLKKGARILLCSHGLKKGTLLARVYGVSFKALKSKLCDFDFQNEYCAILTCDASESKKLERILAELNFL